MGTFKEIQERNFWHCALWFAFQHYIYNNSQLQDRTVLPSGKMSYDINTATVLTTARMWSWIPEGLIAKTA